MAIKKDCKHAPCRECLEISLDATKSDYLICCRCQNLIRRTDLKHQW
jgi:hypothetical protein